MTVQRTELITSAAAAAAVVRERVNGRQCLADLITTMHTSPAWPPVSSISCH